LISLSRALGVATGTAMIGATLFARWQQPA
jgi:hypothetical protein